MTTVPINKPAVVKTLSFVAGKCTHPFGYITNGLDLIDIPFAFSELGTDPTINGARVVITNTAGTQVSSDQSTNVVNQGVTVIARVLAGFIDNEGIQGYGNWRCELFIRKGISWAPAGTTFVQVNYSSAPVVPPIDPTDPPEEQFDGINVTVSPTQTTYSAAMVTVSGQLTKNGQPAAVAGIHAQRITGGVVQIADKMTDSNGRVSWTFSAGNTAYFPGPGTYNIGINAGPTKTTDGGIHSTGSVLGFGPQLVLTQYVPPPPPQTGGSHNTGLIIAGLAALAVFGGKLFK